MPAIDAWLDAAGSPFSNRVSKEWGMSPMMQRYMKSQTTSSASDSAFAIGSRNQAGHALQISYHNKSTPQHVGCPSVDDTLMRLMSTKHVWWVAPGHSGDQPHSLRYQGKGIRYPWRLAYIYLFNAKYVYTAYDRYLIHC